MLLLYTIFLLVQLCLAQKDEVLLSCGEAFYLPSQYGCFDGDFLCPVLNGERTYRCGPDCYLPSMYSCSNGKLVYPPVSSGTAPSPTQSSSLGTCTDEPNAFEILAPPYSNYFYSDCHSSNQLVVTSPESDSNLTIISPRIIVAWPAGNSGIAAYFAPENGINGTLGIRVVNSTSNTSLTPIYEPSSSSNATVGISTQLEFNSSAVLKVAILGGIRTIRDFSEGPSLLYSEIQDALQYNEIANGVSITRLWLDNITTTTLSFTSTNSTLVLNTTSNSTITFSPGTYTLSATFNYPQLTSYSTKEVFNPGSADLATTSPQQSDSLAFLSYTTKLLAGGWRFLTYFGRDSMISALLLEPVLSAGEGGALEAVLAGVLERVNASDGSVCHEETIGDYATWLNLKDNVTSTAPLCDYKMIDTDDFLPILMDHYFLRNQVGGSRIEDFLSTKASILPENSNYTYLQLANFTAVKLITRATPFTHPNNQTKENLIHLKPNEVVGQWRDSTYGLGGGRIPFDVNTALVPAALRSIAALSRAPIFDFDADEVDVMAQIWEDETLQFFEVSIPTEEAVERLDSYASSISVPSQSSNLSAFPSENLTFYAIALDGNNNLSKVEVMHTDDCFRHFLLNTTNQSQLTSFLNISANNINRRFPAGLRTDVGLVVANPAYGDAEVYRLNFTTSAYHGTVVWSWQLAMMARGLELQLSRCQNSSSSSSTAQPDFCTSTQVYNNVKSAYNNLWDVLDENREVLSNEVWSWTYDASEDGFRYIDLGQLPPPPGNNPTESNAVQLWSLTFLAVGRDENLR